MAVGVPSRAVPPGYEPDPDNPGQVRRIGSGSLTPKPGSPQNPIQTGPTMQQVLDAGGSYSRTPQVGTGTGPGGRAATASYSLPITGPTTPYQRQAEARAGAAADAALAGLQGAFRGGGGVSAGYTAFSGAAPTVQYPQVSMSPVPDASAAQSAAFSQAKSRAGAMGRSALESLRGELADRGILGGGTEARGIASQLAATVSPLSDLNVAQLHEQLGIAERGQQLGAQQAAQQYQGGITQRGQDIQQQQFQAQLAQQMELARMQQLQQALSGLMRSY